MIYLASLQHAAHRHSVTHRTLGQSFSVVLWLPKPTAPRRHWGGCTLVFCRNSRDASRWRDVGPERLLDMQRPTCGCPGVGVRGAQGASGRSHDGEEMPPASIDAPGGGVGAFGGGLFGSLQRAPQWGRKAVSEDRGGATKGLA